MVNDPRRLKCWYQHALFCYPDRRVPGPVPAMLAWSLRLHASGSGPGANLGDFSGSSVESGQRGKRRRRPDERVRADRLSELRRPTRVERRGCCPGRGSSGIYGEF